MKAVAIMLREHPILNASLDDETQEIVKKYYYNLGIAVATERGLVVPVVKDVDQKGLLQLAQELSDLSDRARAMRLSQDDISDGTFTITSLGKLGGILATPILNPGEVAILGVHRMIERAVFVDGQVVPRQLMNLSLSFDHRVVDGYDGAYAVQRLKELLENPDLLMLEMR
jgi:pyruvate dehydrogenase E2 component (dihydrolipoamide acetyltransferase)